MRNFFALVIYTLILLMVGRNISFLPQFTLFSPPKAKADVLTSEIAALLKGKAGNYAVYFVDLKTGQSVAINNHEIFTAASVNKLPIVATLYHLAGEQKINLAEQVTVQADDIQDYGTGIIRYEQPGAAYSLRTLSKLTLQDSDNTGAHILANRIGMAEVQSYMETLGLRQTDMAHNETSLADIYLLLSKLYNRKITSDALTMELLGFMTHTDSEDRLPAGLAKSVVVYHKSGDGIGSVHDVGIIKDGSHIYFLGVMTSDIGSHASEAKATIAKIARTVVGWNHSE